VRTVASEAIGSVCALRRRLERACNAVSHARWIRRRAEMLSGRAILGVRTLRQTSSVNFTLISKSRDLLSRED